MLRLTQICVVLVAYMRRHYAYTLLCSDSVAKIFVRSVYLSFERTIFVSLQFTRRVRGGGPHFKTGARVVLVSRLPIVHSQHRSGKYNRFHFHTNHTETCLGCAHTARGT